MALDGFDFLVSMEISEECMHLIQKNAHFLSSTDSLAGAVDSTTMAETS